MIFPLGLISESYRDQHFDDIFPLRKEYYDVITLLIIIL